MLAHHMKGISDPDDLQHAVTKIRRTKLHT